jgi:hypothetical protein
MNDLESENESDEEEQENLQSEESESLSSNSSSSHSVNKNPNNDIETLHCTSDDEEEEVEQGSDDESGANDDTDILKLVQQLEKERIKEMEFKASQSGVDVEVGSTRFYTDVLGFEDSEDEEEGKI